jgi:threonine aldolase
VANIVTTPRGAITPEMLDEAIEDHTDDHVSRLALVCSENTHNRHGGIVPLEALRAARGRARERGVRVHLDGARCGTRASLPGCRSATRPRPPTR